MQNCVANWPLILEYLKVLLSWPPLAFIGACIVIAAFRQQLAEKLDRLIEAKGKDWHARFQEPTQNVGTSPPAPPTADSDYLTQVTSDPAKARVEILKWWTAAASENAFHRMHGTQWRLLEYVLSRGEAGAPAEEVRPFYDEHLKLGESVPGFVPPTIDQYIGFLVGQSLIIIASDHKGGMAVQLTPLGHEFIKYIKENWAPFLGLKGL
ncbi:hypothetical protein QMO14_16955 [Variovorax sp. CAN2819]|uniref:hypothetical protein n=1 Tax=Variovorax sp. CAN15 TaxID=3046727 RepID=UPI0026491279|nr:hypothetical protein [Variovorax sp. CAN15]MDN6885297.1 hypothetical protein [Variovorax sp. CAN15]